MLLRLLCVFAAVGALVSAPAPVAVADPCPDVDLVFARGTAEPPGLGRVGDALAAAQMETRRYAKRQLTWGRGQAADWPRLTTIEPELQWRQFLALNAGLTPP